MSYSSGIKLQTHWPNKEDMLKTSGAFATFVPTQVHIPLQQGNSAVCEPLVRRGDTVRAGQIIGDTTKKMGVPVHASVSGTVIDIKKWPQAGGGQVLCISIENDGRNEPDSALTFAATQGPLPLAADEILDRVHRAGIIGMGGAGFPTHIKLDTGDAAIDYVLLNGAESEPLLDADNTLMQKEPAHIAEGCRLAMCACGAKKGIIGIEDNKPQAIAAMRNACENLPDVTVAALPTVYPRGGEKQLIQSLISREVPEGALPSKAGAVVLNVATAAAVAAAVNSGHPLTRRICTVTGDVTVPQNLLFPIGTLASDLIDFCGGFLGKPSKVILGGPMMGETVERLDIPLTKVNNGIVVVGEARDVEYAESPCIRCNRCAQACPMYLVPWAIDRYWRSKKLQDCKRFKAESCINCGCCTYVCPATRHLAENIVAAKKQLQKPAEEERA